MSTAIWLKLDQETSKRLRRDWPWPLTESRGRKIAIGPRPANLKSDYAASYISIESLWQLRQNLNSQGTESRRGRASMAKRNDYRWKLEILTESARKKYCCGQWQALMQKKWDFESQVHSVSDTVHLQVSGSAESQGQWKTMDFNLLVQCVFSQCTCKSKTIGKASPCKSAVMLSRRCTVSFTHCTCKSDT